MNIQNKLINKSHKIYVAGHNGMVGKAILKELIKNGYKNVIFSYRDQVDLENSNDVEAWFKKNKPDVVIIAAAMVGGIVANNSLPTEFLLRNLKIQNNLIEISWKLGVKRLLFLGSSCIYPKFSKQPIKEEYLLKSELEPTNEWYALAKICGIKLCQALRMQYNFDAICLMPTNLYGPGDNYHETNSHVMASFIRKFCEAKRNNLDKILCWGTGNPLREFLHVEDLAKASLFLLEYWNPSSRDAPLDDNRNPLYWINVGTGKDLSIKDLSILIAKMVDYKGQIIWDTSKPDGSPKKLLCIEKIKNLGWEPSINLEIGISNTIKMYKKELESGSLRSK
tara:strand:+ start:671 stop:1681 length:1011 start_codon:yes stop_codon:yes gene_type:complete